MIGAYIYILSHLAASIRRQDARCLSGLKAGSFSAAPDFGAGASAGLQTPEHRLGRVDPSIQAVKRAFKPFSQEHGVNTPANFAGLARFRVSGAFSGFLTPDTRHLSLSAEVARA